MEKKMICNLKPFQQKKKKKKRNISVKTEKPVKNKKIK